MATVLTYNGVTFDDIKTTQFQQVPQLTDDKVQYLYDEDTIRITAWFNAALHPATDKPGGGVEYPPSTWGRVAKCLNSPRQTLIFQQDGIDIINPTANSNAGVPPGYGVPDPKGGPYPKVLSAKQLSSQTWEVEFEVVTYICQCCSTQQKPPALLANRWTESVAIDQLGYSTVTRKGRAYFRYDMLVGKINGGILQPNNGGADGYRQQVWAACPLKAGFLRTNMDVILQSDGMAFDYTITDKEVFAMPPQGVQRATATWKLSTQKGAVFQQDIQITVEGFKTTPKSQLFSAAAKMQEAILGSLKNAPVFNGSWETDLFNNSVTVTIQVLKSSKRAALDRLQVMSSAARQGPWAGKDNQIPDPGSRGSARLQLVASLLGDPCSQQTIVVGSPKYGYDKMVQGSIDQTT